MSRELGPLRVTLRTHRRKILVWAVPLLGLLAVVSPSYSSTYPRLDQRQHLIDSLGSNAATRMLYGPIPRPGTIGQLAAWEMGTYLIIVVSILGLLLGSSFVRGAEDSGIAELVQATGHGDRDRLRGAMGAALVLAVGLGAAVFAILGVETFAVEELTWQGAAGLGLVTFGCMLFFTLTGLLFGELADSAGLAKSLGFAVLAVAFALRAVANVHGVDALHWISPLGWLDAESPYTEDRWWAGAVFVVVCAALGALVWRVGRGRDYLAAPLHERAASDDRLQVGTVTQLVWHLERGRWAIWTTIVTGVAALFGGMSGSLLDVLAGDDSTAKLMRDVTGEADLAAAFFSFAGVLIGMLVSCYAVSTVLADGAAEADGSVDDLLACGTSRRTPLLARLVVALGGALAMAAVAAVVGALITWSQSSQGADRYLAYVAGQVPAVLALAGIAALVVGVHRRWGPVVWLPVAGSAVLVFLGSVLHAPDWLQQAGVFAHVPDYVGGASPSVGVGVLVACFVVSAAAGVVWRSRRDLVVG
ncbi:hypothetical protein [Flexivirga sp. B27]